MTGRRHGTGRGFTLLEILLAISIMAAVTTVTYLCFTTVASAWKRSQALSNDIHHADFVMEQLEMALRSTYFQGAACGFVLEDGGDDSGADDSISWVKLGSSLVGAHCPFLGIPHRVKFFVEDAEDGGKAVAFKAWALRGQTEDFDPDDLPSFPLSKGITGFNCRPRDPLSQELEWMDDWEDTNKIPTSVELTLFMEPLDEGEEPVEIKRIVEIPVGQQAWGAGQPVPRQTNQPAPPSGSSGAPPSGLPVQ